MAVLEAFGYGRAASSICLWCRAVSRERLVEAFTCLAEQDPVLRPARSRDRRDDLTEVELDDVGEHRLLGVLVVPKALLAGVGLDELDLLGRPPRELEVAQRLGVDREDRHGRAELGRHVADRCAVGERQIRETGAEELDEAPDHALGAEQFGDRKDEVGGRCPFAHRAVELEPDDLRHEHRQRLAEHRRFSLDAADAPAENPEAVDHRRV